MEKLEKARRLKKLLEQIAPRNSLESLPAPKPQRGLESTAAAAPISSGLQKLAENRHAELTSAELLGLEAIVLPQRVRYRLEVTRLCHHCRPARARR